MSRPQGINPIAGGVLAYQSGLRTSQAVPMTRDEKIAILKEIADLEQTYGSITQQGIKTFGQIAAQSQQAKGRVIAAYAQALGNVSAAEQQKLRGNMDLAISIMDQLDYVNPTFTAENATRLAELSGAARGTMMNKVTEQTTPEQYVNEYIRVYKEQAKDTSTPIGSQLSQIRLSYNTQNRNAQGAEERISLANQATIDTQDAAAKGAMEAISGQSPEFQAQVQDLLINRSGDFTEGIIPTSISDADRAAATQSREDKIRQIEELTKDFRRAGGIGPLDEYIGAIGTTSLDEIVNGGLKGMAAQMEAADFAPETRKAIQYLKDQLETDAGRLDAFDTAIARYNSIPGVPALREALGFTDDVYFAQYMSKVPRGFNEALLDIKKQAEAQGIEIETLDANQMRGLVARQLATDESGFDEQRAVRLSRSPYNMRRLLAKETIQGARATARETARAGLGETEEFPFTFVAPGADRVDMSFLDDEGIDVKEPKPQPKADTTARIEELRNQIRTLEVIQNRHQPGSTEYNQIAQEIAAADAELNALMPDQDITFLPQQAATQTEQAATQAATQTATQTAAARTQAVRQQIRTDLPTETAQIAQSVASAPDETEETSHTPTDTPSGAAPPSGGMGGYKQQIREGQIIPEVDLVSEQPDLSQASKGILEAKPYRPELQLTPEEKRIVSAIQEEYGPLPKNPANVRFMARELGFQFGNRQSKALAKKLEAELKKQQQQQQQALEDRLGTSPDPEAKAIYSGDYSYRY